VTRESIREYAAAQRERYRCATRAEKGRILDEVVAVTGYHRKAAIRLLRRAPRPPTARPRAGRPRVYDAAVAGAARVVWEAAGQIGAKRLQPFVPELLDRLVACGELALGPATAGLLRAVSAATFDRLLAPARATVPPRGRATTRAGSLLKGQIPIKTFADWDDARPGFVEVDLVAHCGASTEGFYLCTLTAVDVATGWVELEAVWGKGQERAGGAVHQVRRRLPVPLLGLDSDNGSEFINHHLFAYCRRHAITFTRSRAYKKNDSAHVEQKNGAIVRHLVGYDRYSSKAAYEQLGRTYRLVRLHTNFFQPVQKLVRKARDGAKVHREYDRARTPYQRLREAGVLEAATRDELEALYRSLNPLRLRRRIDAELERLWSLAAGPAAPARRQDEPEPVTSTSEAPITLGNSHL
jgi:Integrase core domain